MGEFRGEEDASRVGIVDDGGEYCTFWVKRVLDMMTGLFIWQVSNTRPF